jgi:hypothetical protein
MPLFLRPLLWLADRVLWPLAVLWPTAKFAKARRMDVIVAVRLYRDCVLTGAGPMDAHVWRCVFGEPHPLPARVNGLLMASLGDPEAHRLLADKLACADHLMRNNVTFPVLRGLYRQHREIDLPAAALVGPGLFVKPRHGCGGWGCFTLTRSEDIWCVDGWPVKPSNLRDQLAQLLRRDDLLLQEHLTAAPELADLTAEGRAPVLRLVTARHPGESPFLHSAFMTIPVPGRNPRHFLDGILVAPIDLASDRMVAALSLADPRRELQSLSWSGAPVSGRALPRLDDAVAMVLRAMTALPALPVVHWDIILTPTGPVLLEGNSAGNWILASLPDAGGLSACSLASILTRWLPARTPHGGVGNLDVAQDDRRLQ